MTFVLFLTETCPVAPGHFKEADPVTAAIGSDVVLPCVSQSKINVEDLILDWNKDQDKHYFFSFLEGKATVDDAGYKDRTSLFTEELTNSNMSLKLSGVTHTDAGLYCCCYHHGDNRRTCTNVTLTISKYLNSSVSS